MRSIPARLAIAGLGALLIFGVSGCTAPGDSSPTDPAGPGKPPVSTSEAYPLLTDQIESVESNPRPAKTDAEQLAANALAVLDTIPVSERTEWDGYFKRQEYFGEGWADFDADGCNTRQEVLAVQLDEVDLNRDQCRVDAGVLHDPYTGEAIHFTRGRDTSDEVQIDHVVALYNAWRTGAQDLTFNERMQLANDPVNLQATASWANDEKASSDASAWLPPNKSYRCTYVARQIAVKATYGLWVTPREDAAMRHVLAACG